MVPNKPLETVVSDYHIAQDLKDWEETALLPSLSKSKQHEIKEDY